MIEVILLGGVLTSIAVSILIFPTYFLCPNIWLGEITDGKEQGNPVLTASVAIATLLLMVIGSAGSSALYESQADVGFWGLFLVAWGVLSFFSVFDLLFIDIIMYMWVKPPFMRFEGYPTLGYWHHTKASLIGVFPIGIPLALLVAWSVEYLLDWPF